jgi:hypothetical protein
MGIPTMADDFRTEMKVSSPIWADTKRVSYKALKFTRGLDKVYNAKSAFNALRALSKGHRQHRTEGDPILNGGVLIARKGGECTYAWMSQVAGDYPKMKDVLESARLAKS